MKIIRIVAAIVVSVLMFVYMMLASVLFAVDLSLDEDYIKNVLNSSDSFAELVRSTELAINSEIEKNTEEIVESFGGSADNIDFKDIYMMPEAAALFADVFTGSARFVLYNEEYDHVNEELVKSYLCAVVNYGADRSVSEQEIEDYLSVGLDVYTEKFSGSVSATVSALSRDKEALDTIRFIFNDVKFIAMAATVIHMLMLILLVKGKIGYFANAAVFGLSGIAMFTVSSAFEKSLRQEGNAQYVHFITEIFKGRFQLMGSILFAVFALFMLIALIKYVRRTKAESE